MYDTSHSPNFSFKNITFDKIKIYYITIMYSRIMLGECPYVNEGCRWYGREPRIKGADNGCFSDTDHIVPRRLATTALSKLFIESPENKQQLCRAEHDEKTALGDEPLPSREVMVDSLTRQYEVGVLKVSLTALRRVTGA